MGKRKEVAQTISRHTRVFVRLARKAGHANVINDMAIQECATKMGISGDAYSLRTVWIDIRRELRLAGELALLEAPAGQMHGRKVYFILRNQTMGWEVGQYAGWTDVPGSIDEAEETAIQFQVKLSREWPEHKFVISKLG